MVLNNSEITNSVVWVFNYPNPSQMGSYRLSGIIPADYLGIDKKIYYKTSPHSFIKNLDNIKLIIIAKPFDKRTVAERDVLVWGSAIGFLAFILSIIIAIIREVKQKALKESK